MRGAAADSGGGQKQQAAWRNHTEQWKAIAKGRVAVSSSVRLPLYIAIMAICSASVAATCRAAEPPAGEQYYLQPGDVLQITVAGHPELTFDSRNAIEIRPDGKFSYPFAGEIMAKGKTVAQITALITQALRNNLRNPRVAVNVIQYRTNEIYVLGEVNKPGAYALPKDRELDIRGAIALAGGLTASACRETAKLFRNGQPPRVIDLRAILAGTSEEASGALQPGDTLVIGRRNMVTVIGEVDRPGNYELPDNGKVSDALALAGGFAENRETGGTRANRTQATLIKADGTTVPVNLAAILSGQHPEADIRMQTGDTLLILQGNNEVAVLGEVAQPGSYYVADKQKLSAVLALAGGVTRNADVQRVHIIKPDGTLCTVDYEPVLREGNDDADLLCAPGDTIVVPTNRNRVAVFGAVARPGVYTIESDDTVLDVIGKAGGMILDKAAPSKTLLMRKNAEEGKPVRINMQDIIKGRVDPQALRVQDGDVILVPESKKLEWDDWTRIISSVANLWWLIDRF